MCAVNFGSLFAGIGGIDLGLERSGMTCKWQVEIDPFCQKVLAKHWPDVERFRDVREVGRHNLQTVDLICGGFPCQPFSEAGKQAGEQDDRNLWPEMARVITEMRPDWIIAENVPGIRNIYLDTVLSDLEDMDYTAGAIDIPAVALGASHIRHRIFVIAHTKGEQVGPTGQSWEDGRMVSSANAMRVRLERRKAQETINRELEWPTQPGVGRVAYGVPDRVDRCTALGNAVVPQVAEWIGRRIVEVEQNT